MQFAPAIPTSKPEKPRKFGEIEELAVQVKKERDAAKKERKRLKQQAKMKTLRSQEDKLWEEVFRLVATKKVKGYEEAVKILKSLKALAIEDKKEAFFDTRLSTMKKEFPRLVGFWDRVKYAKVWGR